VRHGPKVKTYLDIAKEYEGIGSIYDDRQRLISRHYKKMKLSRLQKTILSLALEKDNKRKKGLIPKLRQTKYDYYLPDPLFSTDVTPADVKVAYYGFPLRKKGKLSFCVAEIGFIRYRNAGVAISRSFAALARRGLVTRNYYGISLTDFGRMVILSKK